MPRARWNGFFFAVVGHSKLRAKAAFLTTIHVAAVWLTVGGKRMGTALAKSCFHCTAAFVFEQVEVFDSALETLNPLVDFSVIFEKLACVANETGQRRANGDRVNSGVLRKQSINLIAQFRRNKGVNSVRESVIETENESWVVILYFRDTIANCHATF
jgi:hypothetical protein